jgi:hypothetical protein
MRSSKVVLTASVVAFASVGLYAQALSSPSATPPRDPARQGVAIGRGALSSPNDYGTAGQNFIEVPASQFHQLDSAAGSITTGQGWSAPVGLYQTSGTQYNFAAGVTSVLPAGALLTSLELDSCDTNASGQHVNAFLVVCGFSGQTCNYYQITTSNNGDGCTSYSNDISGLNLFVNKFDYSYTLLANTDAFDGTNVINGVILGYKLQVSAAPAFADFGDVPTGHPFFQFIEALYAAGITRGQMAVFLSKALGLYHQY